MPSVTFFAPQYMVRGDPIATYVTQHGHGADPQRSVLLKSIFVVFFLSKVSLSGEDEARKPPQTSLHCDWNRMLTYDARTHARTHLNRAHQTPKDKPSHRVLAPSNKDSSVARCATISGSCQRYLAEHGQSPITDQTMQCAPCLKARTLRTLHPTRR